ncbi:WD40 repeat-like protein [Ascodesmis nigricans]|uniref:WD40 repeat-like protein n=1 Tax=Ascodesmis nigricans TaxID=341454 RepID=A0A4S2N5F6_9PEZI|nr:WD40 repeat-like protein [Ascodesmis nigricans]
MNLSLLDPFTLAHEFPDTLQAQLRSGHSTVIRFNRKGDLLASGRVDGTVVLFDVETNSLAKVLRGHIRQVQYLSWSSCGRYLISCAQDFKAIRWDLGKTGEGASRTVRFSAPVYCAELHPDNVNLFVSSLYEDVPHLVDISSPQTQKHALPTAPLRPASSATRAVSDSKQLTTCSIFTHNGHFILTGTNKGWLNLISTATLQILYSTRISNGCITYLRLSTTGRHLVTNSSDRIIRSVHLPSVLHTPSSDPPTLPADFTLTEENRFQDVVNRLLWNHVTFSGGLGDHITASTYHNHDIYIWERTSGVLSKILEGPKEEFGSLEWHPSRPMIAAVGLETGSIYIWGVVQPQRWSALAPDFGELEENLEYEEREDEFDIHPEEETKKRRRRQETEKVDVGKWDTDNKGFRLNVEMVVDSEGDEEEGALRVSRGERRRRRRERRKKWSKMGDGGCGGM